MSEQITLAPCPFCEGPPCVIAHNWITGVEVTIDHPQSEALDESYEAHVWCHDCGAQGPRINTCSLGTFERIYDLTARDTMRIAAERWNNRHARARGSYDAGARDGLNLFPRNEDTKGAA